MIEQIERELSCTLFFALRRAVGPENCAKGPTLPGGRRERLSLRFPTNHQPPQVIPRPINELIVLADDLESTPAKLARDDRQRHLMSVIRVSRAWTPIDDYDAAARPKRLTDPIEHHLRITELVVGVTDQHCIHAT